jgi:hypothetical protein
MHEESTLALLSLANSRSAQKPEGWLSRWQSASALQDAKQVTGPSVRQTPVRQSRSLSAAHEDPAPPFAVVAAGVKPQVATMLACGSSAGRNCGSQKSCSPSPALATLPPQDSVGAVEGGVSVTHDCPHRDKGPQYPKLSSAPDALSAPTIELQVAPEHWPLAAGLQIDRHTPPLAEVGAQIKFHSQDSMLVGSHDAPSCA